jgi:hypothetical protein
VVVNNFFQAARLASREAWKRSSLVFPFGWGAATSQTMGKTWWLRIYSTGGHADELLDTIKRRSWHVPETCLFCDQPGKSCKPSKSVDFICSVCVQLLLEFDQTGLKRAYEKALSLGYMGKASAIKTFLIPEDDNAETEEPERGVVRERAMQAVRPARHQVRA